MTGQDLVQRMYQELSQIPGMEAKINSMDTMTPGIDSAFSALERDELGSSAYSYLRTYLMTAQDALHTLHLASVRLSADSNGDNHARVCFTTNGTAALLRQAYESLLYANWILTEEAASWEEKGYALMWAEYHEYKKYGIALKPGDTRDLDKKFDRMMQIGLTRGLISRKTVKGKEIESPAFTRRDAITLSGRIKLEDLLSPDDLDVLSALEKEHPGIVDAKWIYRWLSGMIHGYSWSSIGGLDEEPCEYKEGSNLVGTTIRPQYGTLLLILIVVLRLEDSVIENMTIIKEA